MHLLNPKKFFRLSAAFFFVLIIGEGCSLIVDEMAESDSENMETDETKPADSDTSPSRSTNPETELDTSSESDSESNWDSATATEGDQPAEICFAHSCNGRGVCDSSTGEVVCSCFSPYDGDSCEDCSLGYHLLGEFICEPDEACDDVDCGGARGTCEIVDGQATCICHTGYAGAGCMKCAAGYHLSADLNGCEEDRMCRSTTCSGMGDCEVQNGTIVCGCLPGYAGLHCDTCAPGFYRNQSAQCVTNQDCSSLECEHGECLLRNGQAVCVCDTGYDGMLCHRCAAGFHADGQSKECIPDKKCLSTTCSERGQCKVGDDHVECECDDDYAGPYCEFCAAAHYRTDEGCVPNEVCETIGECNAGTCRKKQGRAFCACDEGYNGSNCQLCAPNFHRHKETQQCVVDEICEENSCSGRGTCFVVEGILQCDCDGGYSGSFCDQCAETYHWEGDVCVKNETCDGRLCNGHGNCTVVDGRVRCVCLTGYMGDDCEICADDYQDLDEDGYCHLKCEFLDCPGQRNQCVYKDGEPLCQCDAGYSGTSCASCAAGYQDSDGDGTCLPACNSSDCPGAHNSCVYKNGAKVCQCDTGYSGTSCASCASGYQDSNGDGTCLPACNSSDCPGAHNSCVHKNGAKVCQCDTGYSGTSCASCASGYQDSDGDGTCLPACSSSDCPGAHNSCVYKNGAKVCQCDTGYSGTSCASCASGYQDSDGDGTCLPACSSSDCPGAHNSCVYKNGAKVCQCDTGYSGTNCASCAAGYHKDSSGNCVKDCVKNCDNKECGSDGCGGVCGLCMSNEQCLKGKCITEVLTCVPACKSGLQCCCDIGDCYCSKYCK